MYELFTIETVTPSRGTGADYERIDRAHGLDEAPARSLRGRFMRDAECEFFERGFVLQSRTCLDDRIRYTFVRPPADAEAARARAA